MFYLFVKMFVLVLVILFLEEGLAQSGESDVISLMSEEEWQNLRANTINNKIIDFGDSTYNPLQNYEYDADPATERDYPWIARVIHSRNKDLPHVCTAVCIEDAIFITAARCIYNLKVNFTSIIYKMKRLHVLAFVFPSQNTKEWFDDIGVIVVKSKNVKGEWSKIRLFNIQRTDDTFAWFATFSDGKIKSKVVGYAVRKGKHSLWNAERQFNLTSLNVVVGLDICPRILTDVETFKAFIVPCYYSCTFDELINNSHLCKKYHGVEGGVVFDTISRKLMGVATWGAHTAHSELPVGFAFANSVSFYKDLACARRIRDDNEGSLIEGYYQTLCD